MGQCTPVWQVLDTPVQCPFQRMTYTEAMTSYGCDKPDLRYGLEHYDVSSAVQGSTFRYGFCNRHQYRAHRGYWIHMHPLLHRESVSYRVFSSALEAGGIVKAMRVPDGKRISNARLKPKGDISGALHR